MFRLVKLGTVAVIGVIGVVGCAHMPGQTHDEEAEARPAKEEQLAFGGFFKEAFKYERRSYEQQTATGGINQDGTYLHGPGFLKGLQTIADPQKNQLVTLDMGQQLSVALFEMPDSEYRWTVRMEKQDQVIDAGSELALLESDNPDHNQKSARIFSYEAAEPGLTKIYYELRDEESKQIIDKRVLRVIVSQ